jgi:hypothetical protein
MTEIYGELTIVEIGVYLLIKTSDEVFSIDGIRDKYGPEAYTGALFLVNEGLLLNDGGDLVFPVKGKKRLSGVAAVFEEARKFYPGQKGGHDPMFAIFKKKSVAYKTDVELLLPAMEKEASYKAHLKATGKHCPDWKNFQTWLNQQCWLQEFPEYAINVQSQAYAVYLQRKDEACPSAVPLSQNIFNEWISKTGPFAGMDNRLTSDGQKSMFWRAHGRDTDNTLKKMYEESK